MMRAYIAIIEIEMVVAAEDEKSARKLAYNNFQNEIRGSHDVQLYPLHHWPNDWEADSIVYSDSEEDVTMQEAWDCFGVKK